MFTNQNSCGAFALGLLVVLASTTTAPAAFVVVNTNTLDQLVLGNSISVGTTTFDQWSVYSNLAFGPGAAANKVVLSNVVVDAGLNDGIPALRFMASQGPLMMATAGQLLDLDFGFRVSVPTPIATVGAELIGTNTTGTGIVALGETLFKTFPSVPVGNLSVSSLAGSMSDTETINPALSTMFVRKDLFVSGGQTGTASLDKVLQYYQQVPEPSSLVLGAMGMLGLVRVRRTQLVQS